MFAILVLAVDLAAFRSLPWPARDFTPLYIRLSLLPMLNLIAILGYCFMRTPGARRPFAVGLLGFGLVTMLVQVVCVWLFPQQLKSTYIVSIGPAFEFCREHRVPYYVGVSDGYSYFRYYPAVVLVDYLVPQLVVAGLGGLGSMLIARRVRERAAQAT
jgi:hypothetical protein